MRALSLLAAIGIALLLLIYPFAFGRELTPRDHTGLAILLLGVSGAFVYGFGYVPERRRWRALFHPLTVWILLAGGLGCLLVP